MSDVSGDTVGGTMTLSALSDDSTGAEVKSLIDLTGRLIQIGMGTVDGVPRQVIATHVKNVQQHLSQSQQAGAFTDEVS